MIRRCAVVLAALLLLLAGSIVEAAPSACAEPSSASVFKPSLLPSCAETLACEAQLCTCTGAGNRSGTAMSNNCLRNASAPMTCAAMQACSAAYVKCLMSAAKVAAVSNSSNACRSWAVAVVSEATKLVFSQTNVAFENATFGKDCEAATCTLRISTNRTCDGNFSASAACAWPDMAASVFQAIPTAASAAVVNTTAFPPISDDCLTESRSRSLCAASSLLAADTRAASEFADDQAFPHVATIQGGFVVAFHSGAAETVRFQRFDASGTKRGVEVSVADGAARATHARVAALGLTGDRFVVAFQAVTPQNTTNTNTNVTNVNNNNNAQAAIPRAPSHVYVRVFDSATGQPLSAVTAVTLPRTTGNSTSSSAPQWTDLRDPDVVGAGVVGGSPRFAVSWSFAAGNFSAPWNGVYVQLFEHRSDGPYAPVTAASSAAPSRVSDAPIERGSGVGVYRRARLAYLNAALTLVAVFEANLTQVRERRFLVAAAAATGNATPPLLAFGGSSTAVSAGGAIATNPTVAALTPTARASEARYVVAWESAATASAPTSVVAQTNVVDASFLATVTAVNVNGSVALVGAPVAQMTTSPVIYIINASEARVNNRFPAASAARRGGFVVAWQLEAGEDIAVQYVNASDALVQSEHTANRYVRHAQMRPAVAWLGGDEVTVAYHSDFQDSSTKGVYVQRVRFGPRTAVTCPTADPSANRDYTAELGSCMTVAVCRRTVCGCFGVPPQSAADVLSISPSAATPVVNGSSLVNVSSCLARAPLLGVSCDQQTRCLQSYRACLETAAFTMPTTEPFECRTWARLFREAGTPVNGSVILSAAWSAQGESCAVGACHWWSQTYSACPYDGRLTTDAVCAGREAYVAPNGSPDASDAPTATDSSTPPPGAPPDYYEPPITSAAGKTNVSNLLGGILLAALFAMSAFSAL